MSCDVLIVYEHRAREIENACLLALELERRGFTTQIHYLGSFKKYFIKARIVVTPHLYNNFHIYILAKNFWRSHNKLISLQYEQVLNSKPVEADDIHDPKEEAIHAQHIAWGEAQSQRYLCHGIAPSNIHITGHIAEDLMYPEFNSYFKSREELSQEFSMDNCKKWVLFFSSFSYANKGENQIAAYEKLNPNAREFADLSNKTQDIFIEWFTNICANNSDIILIYRPHPAEIVCDGFKKMEKKYSNFRIIREYTARQWIKSADLLYTWYSTSLADTYFAKKQCLILRPIDIPAHIEVDLLKGCIPITSFEEFSKSLYDLANINSYPYDVNRLVHYYGSFQESRAYIRIADLCEKMMNENMGYNYTCYGNRWNISNDKGVVKILISFISHILCDLCLKIKLSNFLPGRIGRNSTLLHFEKECFHVNEDILEIKERLKPIIGER